MGPINNKPGIPNLSHIDLALLNRLELRFLGSLFFKNHLLKRSTQFISSTIVNKFSIKESNITGIAGRRSTIAIGIITTISKKGIAAKSKIIIYVQSKLPPPFKIGIIALMDFHSLF